MKLIDSSVEIWKQGYTLEDIYKHIERCGRICYKSEDKITESSYKKFIENLKSKTHFSVFEHGTVYLTVPTYSKDFDTLFHRYRSNPYSIVHIPFDEACVHITTNMRVILEHHYEEDLKYICEPTESHYKRITAHVICSISTSREWNRHRVFSVSEQSSRYCNYSKDKFGNKITFIKPEWVTKLNSKGYTEKNSDSIREFLHILEADENSYMLLINKGLKPQEAREVLPLSTATEVVYTGFEDDWKHFFDLRCAESAHPDVRKLANKLKLLIDKQ
jgi:thymidylate synthase (FAD)